MVSAVRIMFQEVTKEIVNEIDPDGRWIPTSSLAQSYCKPLRLILKKKPFFPFFQDKFIPMSITLTDILQDSKNLDFGLESSPVARYGQGSGSSVSASVCAPIGEAGADISGSKSDAMSEIEMIKRAISKKKLDENIQDRKIDRENSFVKQLKDDFIYVITEVIETKDPCYLVKTFKASLGMKFLLKPFKGSITVSVVIVMRSTRKWVP
ncbi:uncharacterized protein LOC122539663 [Chiloscyllium plagiosum]|uniref:uncharacterized protein LOC122539663 n=1 Tax=Chiloscyllium plagiosum TaxID=36176 RepID=UPI001CB7E1AA|nr:uncharacterized protein LOC122539663 [Chiloscyllium plagiosum]